MDQRIVLVGVLGWCACAGPQQTARFAPREAAPITRASSPLRAKQDAAPPASAEPSDSARNFLVNAERAIGEYREFMARAGNDPQYAAAVKRSGEQIEDLQTAMIFVRAGMNEGTVR